MNATTGAVWLGHCRTGGRLYLRRDELHPGMNLIGNGVGSLAAVVARACDEAGMKTLVLDFGGRLSERLPNLETRSFGNFLYDSMRMEKSSVASFSAAESHQAAEVAVMLFLAKVLALSASGAKPPDVLIVDAANRIFSNMPVTRHGNRLLITLLSSEMARVFASEATYGLDHHFVATAPTRILSSSLWNDVVV